MKVPGDPDKIIDGESLGTKFKQRGYGGCFLKKMAAGQGFKRVAKGFPPLVEGCFHNPEKECFITS